MTLDLNQFKNHKSDILVRCVGLKTGKRCCFLGIYLFWRSDGTFLWRRHQGGQLVIQGWSSREWSKSMLETDLGVMREGDDQRVHMVGIQ